MTATKVVALTREVSPALASCELTHLEREPIDIPRARAQHDAYEACLRELGCRVERLEAGPNMPDSVFIEDTAVVFDEIAIMTRPGAESRRQEVAAVADALQTHRALHRIEAPGTIDGGDVLIVGRRVFVGRSGRTNRDGIEQMITALGPYGYAVEPVEVRGCLHLKSAVTRVGEGLLLMNPDWLPGEPFRSFDRVEVHPAEPYAANAVIVRSELVYPSAFPRTLGRLERRGIRVHAVDVSELAKAEGAVTCCSLLVPHVVHGV